VGGLGGGDEEGEEEEEEEGKGAEGVGVAGPDGGVVGGIEGWCLLVGGAGGRVGLKAGIWS
jgi:hypothetical protein